MPIMKPIQTTERMSLKQQVIQAVKQYIVDEEVKAGDKLPTERKLAEMFGVSRSVIREAMSYLENTGVIRVRQGQGAFLNESNIDKLLDNFFFLRSEEHTSELQSRGHLVCRLLLEKKK